tara:strand:- start:17 stop:223 length:207 start_codon:yes stop_codon:yes gene_type:complete
MALTSAQLLNLKNKFADKIKNENAHMIWENFLESLVDTELSGKTEDQVLALIEVTYGSYVKDELVASL